MEANPLLINGLQTRRRTNPSLSASLWFLKGLSWLAGFVSFGVGSFEGTDTEYMAAKSQKGVCLSEDVQLDPGRW
jgi:beta-lactamase regulating signal transducer with metallopeptidase domain